MDFLEFPERVMVLLMSGQLHEAELELQHARLLASEQSDSFMLERVLAELSHLYCLMQPPDFEKAEMYCLERERVDASGQSKLQTAMMYYWSMHAPERTLEKVQQAAALARGEEDATTLYQCIALSGLALLDLGRTEEAADVLVEIEQMVTAKRQIVVGDETLFLERFLATTEQRDIQTLIKSVARALWRVCRDSEFAARLKTLAKE